MKFLAVEQHGGWRLFRWGWALTMLFTWGMRGVGFAERFTDAGPIVRRVSLPLAHHLVLSEPAGWVVYGVLMAALVAVLVNRGTRAAVVVAMVIHTFLCLSEGLNYKGYDRLMVFQGICMLIGPKGLDGKDHAVPIGRVALLILYCSLYGQTGIHKILDEPRWWDGSPLAYDLVHRNFGGLPLGVALSGMPGVMKFMSWSTLGFETGFPLLIWIRPVRPWLLLVGMAFHLGILVLMYVPSFTLASIAAYPLLLDPEQYRRVEGWVLARMGRRAA